MSNILAVQVFDTTLSANRVQFLFELLDSVGFDTTLLSLFTVGLCEFWLLFLSQLRCRLMFEQRVLEQRVTLRDVVN